MTLYACGINHKTASVAIREKVVFDPTTLDNDLQELFAQPYLHEVLILSTCNRTEIYCVADETDSLKAWFTDRFGLSADILDEFWYAYHDAEAVRHAMRVACGLDSMVIGETEILGQMKHAYMKASYAGSVGAFLEKLFSRVFHVAKKVRTTNEIGACPVSLASMAVKLIKQQLGDASEKTILLLGAGETAALTARHLFADNIKNLIVASRNIEKAAFLTEQFSGQAIALQDLYEHLPKADVVITATASSLPVVTKGALEKVYNGKPLLCVDVAVPRDVEPDVAELPGVTLFSIDDLKDIIDENMRSRAHSANKAEEVVKQHVKEFVKWIASLDASSIIKAYREHVESIRDEELAKALLALEKGAATEDVLPLLARNLTNKFLHKPSVNMRKAGFDGRMDLLELTYELFELEA